MARSVSSSDLPLPLPIGGINSELPLYQLPATKTQFLYNWDIDNRGFKLRPAYKISSSVARSHSINMHWLQDFNNIRYACVIDPATNFIRYVTASGAWATAYAPGIARTSDNTPSLFIRFGNRLMSFARPFTASAVFDGAVWGALGYTFGTISDPYIPGAYRGRMYVGEFNGLRVEYFPVGAIAGASAGVLDLSGVINSGTLAGIANVSVSDSAATDEYICFISTTGELAYYTGDNPAAANWRLVAKVDLNTAISPSTQDATYNNFFPVGGDKYLCTQAGVYSLRQAFLNVDQSNVSESVNAIWKVLTEANGAVGTYVSSEKRFYYLFRRRVRWSYAYDFLNSGYGNPFGFSTLMYDQEFDGWFYWDWASATGATTFPEGRRCPFVIGTSTWGQGAGGFDRNAIFYFDPFSQADDTNNDLAFGVTYNIKGRFYFNPSSVTPDFNNTHVLNIKAHVFAGATDDTQEFDISAGIDVLDYADVTINQPLNNNLKTTIKAKQGAQFITFNVGAMAKASIPWIEAGVNPNGYPTNVVVLSTAAEIEKGASLG